MKHSIYTQEDFHRNPLMLYYEVTQACDLVCKHCRASAQENPGPMELSTEDSKKLIDQVATFPRFPTLVITGGDPLKRADLFDLISHAVSNDLQVALTPSATPLATFEAFQQAKAAGIHAFGISLDGADAKTHDAFRGFDGSFDKTLEMLANARQLRLPVQVNTSVTRRNVHQIDEIAELLSTQDIAMWSVFFLVPVGRGTEEERILPVEYEKVFSRLWHNAQYRPYAIKTTEAPHYRRYVLRQGGDPLMMPKNAPGGIGRPKHRAPLGVTDGRGIMFVSHIGEIYPAGFLPLVCGHVPNDSIVDIYQNHPTFRALQDPNQFKGICGACEYRFVCGGSRARAYAVYGDPLGPEPDCVYTPGQDPMPKF